MRERIIQYRIVFLKLQQNSLISCITCNTCLSYIQVSLPKKIAIKMCDVGKIVNIYICYDFYVFTPSRIRGRCVPLKVDLPRPVIEENNQIDAIYCPAIIIIPHTTAQFISADDIVSL